MISFMFVFFICLLLAAFFSGAEMAFVSSNKLRIHRFADSGNRAAKILIQFIKRPQHLLTTILIGNNIVHVVATAALTYTLSTQFGISSEWLVTLIMTPTLLIFGEMVPKDYGRLRSNQFLLDSARPLAFVSRVFHFFTIAILKIVDFFLAPFGLAFHKSIFVSEEEFRHLIEESTRSGVVGPHEKKIIDTILDFEKIHVESVMVFVSKVPVVDIRATVGDVKKIARQTNSRMVLVYDEIPSIIMGMIYVFDLLFEERDQAVLKDFLRSPVFIPKGLSNEEAFFTLQQKRQSYALVMDERREVIGVVSIESLIGI